jgi:hypothetical protein
MWRRSKIKSIEYRRNSKYPLITIKQNLSYHNVVNIEAIRKIKIKNERPKIDDWYILYFDL